MPNTQTGPYPVLFAKNTTRARINLQTTVGGTHFRRSLGPGETKEVPWVIAKSAGFHRLWLDGKLEVSDRFDFSTTLDELPAIGASGDPVEWDEVEGKPEEFPPAEHTRSWDEITGKPEEFPPENHSHSWAQVTGKPTAFTPSSHDHTIAQVTNLQSTLDGKAASSHDHTIAQVTGLQDELDGKAASDHTHAWGDVTGKPATFAPTIGTTATTAVAGNDPRLTDSRTPTTHTHTWAEITDPPTIPDAAPVAEAQADSTATDVEGLVTDFNSLLAKLRAAGIIAS